MKLFKLVLICFVFSTALIACKHNGDDSTSDAGIPTPTPPTTEQNNEQPSNNNQTGENVIIKKLATKAANNILQSDDGELTITIPPNALPMNEVEIVVTRITGDKVPSQFSQGNIDFAYDLKPDGLEFKSDISVEIRKPQPITKEGETYSTPILALLTEASAGNKLETSPLKNVKVSLDTESSVAVISGSTNHFSTIVIANAGLSASFSTGLNISSLTIPEGQSFIINSSLTLFPDSTIFNWKNESLTTTGYTSPVLIRQPGTTLTVVEGDPTFPDLTTSTVATTLMQPYTFTCNATEFLVLELGFDLTTVMNFDLSLTNVSTYQMMYALPVNCGGTTTGSGSNSNTGGTQNSSGVTVLDPGIVTCDVAFDPNNPNQVSLTESNKQDSIPIGGVDYPSCTFPDDGSDNQGNSKNQIPTIVRGDGVDWDLVEVPLPQNRIAGPALRLMNDPESSTGNASPVGDNASRPLEMHTNIIFGFVDPIMQLMKNGETNPYPGVSQTHDGNGVWEVVLDKAFWGGRDFTGKATVSYGHPVSATDALLVDVKLEMMAQNRNTKEVEAGFGRISQTAILVPLSEPPPTPLPKTKERVDDMAIDADFAYVKLTPRTEDEKWKLEARDITCKAAYKQKTQGNVLTMSLTDCSDAVVGIGSNIVVSAPPSCAVAGQWDLACIKLRTVCTDANGCPLANSIASNHDGRAVHNVVGFFGSYPFPSSEFDPFAGTNGTDFFGPHELYDGTYGFIVTGNLHCIYGAPPPNNSSYIPNSWIIYVACAEGQDIEVPNDTPKIPLVPIHGTVTGFKLYYRLLDKGYDVLGLNPPSSP
ncbi:MAG: hypothetical protein OEZ47_03280 [Gammaproteobacteria bacterium]|nr:hypothetical protein [Gammaproteobacteria bacterium]